MRPLSTKEPLHLVLKARRQNIVRRSLRAPREFFLVQEMFKKYAAKFLIKIEQISIQGDHVHALIRTSRRSNYLSFFRVLAGQISQGMSRQGFLVTDTRRRTKGLWWHRPFTRIVKGYKAYKTVRNYIRLNEKEALGTIPYRKERLKGLAREEWDELWK